MEEMDWQRCEGAFLRARSYCTSLVCLLQKRTVTINAGLLLLLILDKEMPELVADQRCHSVGLFIRIAEG